ncbi:CPBP family intramembrane metalloprotease [Haliea sp. E1-2-M8]|uniref:CPBP family intramembrane glutamic endopeptidase n=1 Tax=Haliea sp. E1-2-M8 TaxID=3064706 RepID=UPI00271921FE|nr:CPBP family intramembrane glutamic endopeptidase [Haliea sp. E1-2-M8]MDO8863950.1 CPBP family intramembrane metalloprotease [Haliea sp. E1-2-M8]
MPLSVGPVRAVLEILIIAGAIFAGQVAAGYVPPEFHLFRTVPILVLQLVPVLAATALLYLARQSWRQLGLFGRGAFARTLLLSLALAAFVVVVVYGLGLRAVVAMGLPPLDVSAFIFLIEGQWAAYLAFMVVVVWGSAAIGEELVFRGFLMNRFEALFHRLPLTLVLAVIAQAVLFGLSHGYQGPTGLLLSGTTGLIFGTVYYASGRNLLLAVLTHGFVNSTFITAVFLGRAGVFFPGA